GAREDGPPGPPRARGEGAHLEGYPCPLARVHVPPDDLDVVPAEAYEVQVPVHGVEAGLAARRVRRDASASRPRVRVDEPADGIRGARRAGRREHADTREHLAEREEDRVVRGGRREPV